VSTITTTEAALLSKPVNVMFTRRFLEVARYQTHYFAGSDPATISRHGGTATALWLRHEHLTPTTTALTELTGTVSYPTRNASTPTRTPVTKAVSKYGDHILLNEEADTFNFNGQTAELLDRLAEQAGRSLNWVQRNEMEDNATLVRAGGAASDGAIASALLVANLDSVVNTLDRNVARTFAAMTTGSENTATVPIMQAFWGICHPDVAYDVSKLTGFKSIETYAGQVQVMPGEIGFYGNAGKGVRFLSTADASIDLGSGAAGAASNGLRGTSDNADLYTTVIYGRNAVGSLGLDNALPTEILNANSGFSPIQIINHGFGSGGPVDPLNELSTLGWKAWSAAQILNGTWIRGIRSGATVL